MKVRSGVVLGVVAVMAAVCGVARAEDGRPSQDTLAAMGLGSMTAMSDEEGLAIRGHGYKGGGSSVTVFGNSFATINGPNGGAHSENGYLAEGKHKAGGQNKSYAGVTIVTSGGHKPSGGGGGYGPKSRGNYGGGNYGGGGGGYGNVKSTTIKYFAGGSSSGYAW